MTEIKDEPSVLLGKAIGTWINRTTATLFFVLLTLKIFGVATLVPLTWWIVLAPIFVRWAFLLVCVIIIGIAAFIREKSKQ